MLVNGAFHRGHELVSCGLRSVLFGKSCSLQKRARASRLLYL